MSTTPKKPTARPPCVAAPAPPAAQPRELAPAELELLAAYAGMNQWAKELLVETAADYAVDFPIKRSPALRLVVGGVA